MKTIPLKICSELDSHGSSNMVERPTVGDPCCRSKFTDNLLICFYMLFRQRYIVLLLGSSERKQREKDENVIVFPLFPLIQRSNLVHSESVLEQPKGVLMQYIEKYTPFRCPQNTLRSPHKQRKVRWSACAFTSSS